jgi:hypothetical protein
MVFNNGLSFIEGGLIVFRNYTYADQYGLIHPKVISFELCAFKEEGTSFQKKIQTKTSRTHLKLKYCVNYVLASIYTVCNARFRLKSNISLMQVKHKLNIYLLQ